MNQEDRLDVLIVSNGQDIKLLRHFLLSYKLFFKIRGNIHVVIWRKDAQALSEVLCPENLVIHYKDDIPELVEDDFRNQMYIKLIGDSFVDTPWFWVVDADFLITSIITYRDFFESDKPKWFYRPWVEIPEKNWRLPSEGFIKFDIPYLFMDEPLYILNKKILSMFRSKVSLTKILTSRESPSEFIVYGAFAYKFFHDYYAWKNSSIENVNSLIYKVNQQPPSYMVLSPDCRLTDSSLSKVCVFWSHWELAEDKMREFLLDAQVREFGRILLQPETKALMQNLGLEDVLKNGSSAWGGCYSDGWVKREWYFSIFSDKTCLLEINLDVFPSLESSYLRLIVDQCDEYMALVPGINKLLIPLSSGKVTTVQAAFHGGIIEPQGKRNLYAIAKSCKLINRELN
ncbi:hypothetical protein [Methylophilus sp. DW102]|uniref:hypothetical protein n=1 Tax=Methylophilus sp. DW102 TaxID=3095607 RepID=UPI00308A0EB2|nr:DUF6492 family protein [Methylophilus sp. DW102]